MKIKNKIKIPKPYTAKISKQRYWYSKTLTISTQKQLSKTSGLWLVQISTSLNNWSGILGDAEGITLIHFLLLIAIDFIFVRLLFIYFLFILFCFLVLPFVPFPFSLVIFYIFFSFKLASQFFLPRPFFFH